MLERLPYLRPACDADDQFLFTIFCTRWESEVALLPNPKLAGHVLRIQHIAQERRYRTHFPSYERFVVLEDGQQAGRLYVDRAQTPPYIVDLTLLRQFRRRGIGNRIFRDLYDIRW